MAWTYEQLFNALSDGDLNGQDSWTRSTGNTMNVQTSVMYEGAKALSVVFSATSQESDYRRTITGVSEGSMYFAWRQSSNTNGNSVIMLKDTGGSYVMALRLPGVINGDSLNMLTDGSDVVVASSFSADTWYPTNIEFDDAGQDNKYRARVYKSGAWSAFTAWSNTVAAYTSITEIRLNPSSGDGGAAHTFYFDSITPTNPESSGPANLKTWNGLATASVKTMDGLAMASVKTWNGLT